MDQLNIKNKDFYCAKHLNKQAIYLSFEKQGISCQYICESCCVSQEYQEWIKLPISEILDDKFESRISNWPPMKDQSLLNTFLKRMDELHEQTSSPQQYINQIQGFFQKQCDNVIAKIKSIEKIYITQYDKDISNSMFELYNNLSQKDKLKQCLKDKDQLDSNNLLLLFQEQLENQEVNQYFLQDQLNLLDTTFIKFNEEFLNQELNTVYQEFDQIIEKLYQQYPNHKLSQKVHLFNNINLNNFNQNDQNDNNFLIDQQQQIQIQKPLNFNQVRRNQTIQEYPNNFFGIDNNNPFQNPNLQTSYIQDAYNNKNNSKDFGFFPQNNQIKQNEQQPNFNLQQPPFDERNDLNFNTQLFFKPFDDKMKNDQQNQNLIPKQMQNFQQFNVPQIGNNNQDINLKPQSIQPIPVSQNNFMRQNLNMETEQIQNFLDDRKNQRIQPQQMQFIQINQASSGNNNQDTSILEIKPLIKKFNNDIQLQQKEIKPISPLIKNFNQNQLNPFNKEEDPPFIQKNNLQQQQFNDQRKQKNRNQILVNQIKEEKSKDFLDYHQNQFQALNLVSRQSLLCKNNLKSQLIQCLQKTKQEYLGQLTLKNNVIQSQQENQQGGIIDFDLNRNILNQSFKVKITYNDPQAFQAVGIIDKQLIIQQNNNISMLPHSNQLNLISMKGLCSKKCKLVDFSFCSQDVIEIIIKEKEIVFKNNRTEKQYSQEYSFSPDTPYCPGFILSKQAQYQIV